MADATEAYEAVRAALGDEAILVTPGIRPNGSGAGDQKRIATPRDAIAAGADLLVLGRPLRDALDPVQVQLASGELSIKKTTSAIEEILIRRALQKTRGNRTRAAELLEISHRALLYKIKDYKITEL